MLKNKTALTPEQATLAANFTRALAESGVAPKAIAEARDITEQAVSNWKRTGKIAKEHLPAIAALTGWSVEQLLNPDPREKPRPESEPVQPMPTLGATILQLGALLATLSPMGQKTIAALVEEVLKDPSKAREAAETADAIARTQRMPVRDESISRSFGRAQEKPVETGMTPLEPIR